MVLLPRLCFHQAEHVRGHTDEMHGEHAIQASSEGKETGHGRVLVNFEIFFDRVISSIYLSYVSNGMVFIPI